MDADADCVSVHVTLSDHEHGVDFHLLGALDFAALMASAALQARSSNRPEFPGFPQTSGA